MEDDMRQDKAKSWVMCARRSEAGFKVVRAEKPGAASSWVHKHRFLLLLEQMQLVRACSREGRLIATACSSPEVVMCAEVRTLARGVEVLHGCHSALVNLTGGVIAITASSRARVSLSINMVVFKNTETWIKG
jgi:hypothetical protein